MPISRWLSAAASQTRRHRPNRRCSYQIVRIAFDALRVSSGER